MKHVLIALLILGFASMGVADVKYATSTKMEFGGTVGTMMNLFGASKPVKTIEYYKGDVKRSDSFDGNKLQESQIIDLEKELFINIDHTSKEYTQMTFAEWRDMLQATMEQFGQEEAAGSEEPEPESESNADVEWEFNVDIQETGERETIAGKRTEKVILTLDLDAEVTSQEEGQEPETAKGGMIVTSNNWLFKGEDAAQREMQAFNEAMVEKLGMLPDQASFKEMMTEVIQSNSQLGEAIEKMQQEGSKLQGISMRNHIVYETKVDPETAKKMNEERAKQQEEENTEIPTSVGGLLGGFGKKMLKKQLDKKDEGVKERNTLMSTTTEVDELSTSTLEASLFQVPADYTQVEAENLE